MAQHPEDDRAAPPPKAAPSPPQQPNGHTHTPSQVTAQERYGHTHTPSQVTAQERYDPRHDERPRPAGGQLGPAKGPHTQQAGTQQAGTHTGLVQKTDILSVHTKRVDGQISEAQLQHTPLPDTHLSHTQQQQTKTPPSTQHMINTQPQPSPQHVFHTQTQPHTQQQASRQQTHTETPSKTQQQLQPQPQSNTQPPPAHAQPTSQPHAPAATEAAPPLGAGDSEQGGLAERVAAAQARQRALEGRLVAVAEGLRRQQAGQLQASLRHQLARHTKTQAPPPPRHDQPQPPARTRGTQQPASEAEAKPPPAADTQREPPREDGPRETAKDPAGPLLTGRARRTARKLEGAVGLLQRLGDDSATESSSGESGDELDPDTDLGRNLNKAWEHYHEQRAEVGWRWGWLGLQIAELDRHIACYESGLKALRAAKRPLPTLPQPNQGCARLLPCASAGRHRTLWKDPPPAPHRLPMLGPEAPTAPQTRLANIDPGYHPVLSRPYEAPPPLLFAIPPLPPPPPPLPTASGTVEPISTPAPAQPEVPPSSPPEDERPIKLLMRQGSKEPARKPKPKKAMPMPRQQEAEESGSYPGSQSETSSSDDDDRPLKRRRVSSVSRVGPEDGPEDFAKRIRRASSSESVRPGGMAPLSLLRRRSKYDINNIVIPANVVPVSRIEKISYKEILTPSWRTLTPKTSAPSTPSAHPATPQSTGPSTPAVAGEESEGSSEDTSDEAYVARHAALAHKEQLRYQAFVNKTRRQRNSQDKSARASISSQGAPSDGPPTPAPITTAPATERPPLPQWSPRRYDSDGEDSPQQEATTQPADADTKSEPRPHSKPHSRQESRSVSPDSTGGGKDKDEEVGWEIVRKKAPGQNVLVLRVVKPH